MGALLLGTAVGLAPRSEAQVPPLGSSTTTTTEPAKPTSTTAPPSGDDFSEGSSKAPSGAKDVGGDGAAAPTGGIAVPPTAQQIIDSVHRTGSSNNDALLASLRTLQDLGLSEAEALRVGLGRFPIAGAANYSHDWLFPRYGPGFRFHLGTDVFADYGTPVRAPVAGVARSSTNGLGGLTVKVFMPDGTYFYLAHLSGLVKGFTEGMTVHTGDIVGYVGDSGNAKGGAPHLHIGIYPHGGAPIDPKPVLDQFLAEATARLPEVVAAAKKARPAPTAAPATPPAPVEPTVLSASLLSPELLQALAAGTAPWPIEVLYLASANALTGPRVLVEVAVDDIVSSIDWNERAPTG